MIKITHTPRKSQPTTAYTRLTRGNSGAQVADSDGARVTLGNITQDSSQPSQTHNSTTAEIPIPGYSIARRDAHRLDQLREISPNSRAAMVCGQVVKVDTVTLARIKYGHTHRARVVAVWRCGKVWECPVCATIAARKRAAQTSQLVRQTIASGGGVVFLTVTVGHHRLESLRTVIDRLQSVSSVLTSGAAALSQTMPGYIGTTSTLEITDGRNGWHPHRHLLLITQQPLDPDQLAALDYTLRAQLVARAARVGAYVEPAHVLDVQAVDSDGVGGYLAKVAQELADPGNKDSHTPWAHLDNITEPIGIARWWEFAEGTTGCNRWQTSPRLAQRLHDQLGITLEPITDQGEIVETLELPLPTWRSLDHRQRCDVIYAFALHGADAALLTLRSVVIIA